jgi:uncharacterized protein (TIGR03437 family)
LHRFVIGLLPIAGLLHAQTFMPRADSGARLEPKGVVMHGAGQDSASYAAYWAAMPIGSQPATYMAYLDLDTLAPNWADSLKAQLLNYPGNFIIPQIGLSMTDSVTNHYEAQVAAGAYDTQIGYLISGLRELANPVYLRIGYEFNGVGWNGYAPAPYVQAFIHVTNMLRAAPDIEVATVWDAEVPDGATDFSDYYPGDSYVDWFGVNVFNSSGFSNSALTSFISLAGAHNKPVMMGETTPEGVGAQAGAASWTGWFVPFFNFLQTTPQVKQFNYIDWNWAYWAAQDNQPSWANWGDARLELDTAAYVRNLYIPELANSTIFNTPANESAFRQLLGLNDNTPPPAVSGLSVSAGAGGTTLTWTPVTDSSGIARYYLYRNNTLLDFSLAPPYTDLSVGLGASSYTIAAMDRAGNMSAMSAPQTINLTQIQRIANGGFENGLSDWQLSSYASGAAGTAVIDTADPMDGTASVKINVSKTTGTNWNLQLEQFFQVTAGLSYTVSFKARASASVTLPVAIQQTPSPYAVYLNPSFTATTSAGSFSYSFTATTSQPVEIGFWVDNIGSATLWLDDISVIESNPQANPPPNLLVSGVQNGASYQAGVVPGSWLALKGANLAAVASDTWANAIVNGALPESLDGVSVSIGGQPAYIYYVSPGQINAIAPNVSPGPATLTITTPGGTSAPVTVNVAAQAPAFFLWPGSQAVATRAADNSYAVKAGTFAGATTVAAHPGDVLILWGTGFGATTPPVTQGIEVPSDQTYNCSPATVTLGSANATVYGCALSPGSAGLYQVAIQVPNSLASGDYTLKVTVNGAVSPDGVILSVSN